MSWRFWKGRRAVAAKSAGDIPHSQAAVHLDDELLEDLRDEPSEAERVTVKRPRGYKQLNRGIGDSRMWIVTGATG